MVLIKRNWSLLGGSPYENIFVTKPTEINHQWSQTWLLPTTKSIFKLAHNILSIDVSFFWPLARCLLQLMALCSLFGHHQRAFARLINNSPVSIAVNSVCSIVKTMISIEWVSTGNGQSWGSIMTRNWYGWLKWLNWKYEPRKIIVKIYSLWLVVCTDKNGQLIVLVNNIAYVVSNSG